jgi:hypothetical protein
VAWCEKRSPDNRALVTPATHTNRRLYFVAEASAEGERQPMSLGQRMLREWWSGGSLLVVLLACWMLANEEFRVGGVLAGCAVLMLCCPCDRPPAA